MGDTDRSESPKISGGNTPTCLEQVAVVQRMVVLLARVSAGAEVREAPAYSPPLTPVIQALDPSGRVFR